MKILDQLIESMGDSEIFQREDGTFGLIVNPKIVEDLEDIRSIVEEMEERLLSAENDE